MARGRLALALAALVAASTCSSTSAARLANGALTAQDAVAAGREANAAVAPAARTAPRSAVRAAAATPPAPLSTAGMATGPDGSRRFLLGYNMGNVRFVPFAKSPLSQSPDELKALLTHALDDMHATGCNAVRFWLHIDGSTSPEWDPATGLVSRISAETVDDLKWVLKSAADRDIAVILSLWSHDILAVRRTNSAANRDRALRLLEDPAALQAYIDRALVPLAKELKSTPLPDHDGRSYADAVWVWETFNEPEGCATDLEFYKNYMYEVEGGDGAPPASTQKPYWYLNPAHFGAEPKRSVDYQNITYIAHTPRGGFLGVDPSDAARALYAGPHFVMRDAPGKPVAGLNEFMYRDVFAQFNSDYEFLLDEVLHRNLTTVGTTSASLARFHNRVAGALHRAVPGAKVTTAAHSLPYTTDVPLHIEAYRAPARNLYSDAALIAAGGDPLGTLDLYQAHTYPDWADAADEFNRELMPFGQPKAHYALDKPLLIGEFWDAANGKGEGSLTTAAWAGLAEKGYAGGLGWAYFEVHEEFGAGLAHPYRVAVPHQMRDHFKPLIAGVASRLPRAVGGRGPGGVANMTAAVAASRAAAVAGRTAARAAASAAAAVRGAAAATAGVSPLPAAAAAATAAIAQEDRPADLLISSSPQAAALVSALDRLDADAAAVRAAAAALAAARAAGTGPSAVDVEAGRAAGQAATAAQLAVPVGAGVPAGAAATAAQPPTVIEAAAAAAAGAKAVPPTVIEAAAGAAAGAKAVPPTVIEAAAGAAAGAKAVPPTVIEAAAGAAAGAKAVPPTVIEAAAEPAPRPRVLAVRAADSDADAVSADDVVVVMPAGPIVAPRVVADDDTAAAP